MSVENIWRKAKKSDSYRNGLIAVVVLIVVGLAINFASGTYG